MTSRGRNTRHVEVRLLIPAPAGFLFERAVAGHGWFDLPPFAWDRAAGTLSRPLRLARGGAALVVVSEVTPRGGDGRVLSVRIAASRPLQSADAAAVRRQVTHMLRLDEDLRGFYRIAREVGRPDLSWAEAAGAGRLLRSPTVFEDLIRMVCTTNCSWALTRTMVSALVSGLGEPAPLGARLFPDPGTMAEAPPRFYREVVRAGYRGTHLRELARLVAAGAIDPEAWLRHGRTVEEVRAEILSLPGAGPYVADNMLKLLGRYDGLGLDSWCRRKFAGMYHRGRAVSDARIARFYASFGTWRGLALWCDVTRDWFQGEGGALSAPAELSGRRD